MAAINIYGLVYTESQHHPDESHYSDGIRCCFEEGSDLGRLRANQPRCFGLLS